MLGSMNLPTKFKQVIQDISGSAAALVDPSLFGNSNDLTSITKSQIAMEARCFNETPVDSRKCTAVITKILYLLCQGEDFSPAEKSELFFLSTRLFQSSSPHLRRMVHLLIKTLQPSQEEAFVVTSILTKDIASQHDGFRANALRTIVRIVDGSTASQLERFIKSAIVDKNPFVASTALLCGVMMAKSSPEYVRRWVNEVSECVSSKYPMVQFHALALLYELKKNDRLALHRIIATLTAKITKSPIAECLLIRYATKLLAQPGDSPLDVSLLEFLETSLGHRSEIVSFEAAKAYVNLALYSPKFSRPDRSATFDITRAITALQILLTNLKPVIRFAAIRILYKIAQTRPDLVTKCNVDIEPLIGDSSRAVAVLALITLLKSGVDQQPDALLKQITAVMIDISEPHRIEIVTALKSLCVQHPEKAKPIVTFLASQLRDEGGVQSKTHTVEVLCWLSKELPDLHESVLLHLCDFIEDCEYHTLCCHILAFLAVEVPQTQYPSKYLRFIYNRCILESATVRGAAIDCLARIAKSTEEVRGDVITVLNSGLLLDIEDEIRDRSRLALRVLKKDAGAVDDQASETTATGSQEESVDDILEEVTLEKAELPFSVDALIDRLTTGLVRNKLTEALDLDALPDENQYAQTKAKEKEEKAKTEVATLKVAKGLTDPEPPVSLESLSTPSYHRAIKALAPPGEDLGGVHHTCAPVPLTESEAEYVVQAVKHFWDNTQYVSLEVFVRNTLEHQALKNVDIRLGFPEQGSYEVVRQTQIPSLKFGEEQPIYVLLRRKNSLTDFTPCSIISQLSYSVIEDDDEAFAYDDVYEMEPIVIGNGDYISPCRVPVAECGRYWNTVGGDEEVLVRMQFGQIKSGAAGAVEKLTATLNMHKNELKSDNTTRVFFTGRLVGHQDLIMVQAAIAETTTHGVLGKVQIRCAQQAISKAVADCLRGV
eukprot:Blabericola_migrator_1__5256@NODE_26_length_20894_cov_127_933788_g23_i0_p3_GENE_NODE_26_length_20894_cov_127_933788_g23_i0NODE_26_length_20894_cov_127_933788_g23_i0_p3_ORF_typecomplete_len944_score207_40Adaptin_N/PF01602_20/1_5e83COPgamma_platf/PF08752_10/8_3e27COPgamma_platf/PF08752_10/2_1e03Coatomer_g_Cpla/PF16381_5/2e08Cnd1/PF12717_7/1_3Cnd1/PF12717_7/5_6e02Cnd1/PF12717_7/0_5Cnd1/PF12717_7/3_6HEAT_2/PF13646_6/13HEAT_2/PF13646_6/2_9HEAT_2/PF13646_6/20HEAT_2/PF13646_6/1_4e04Vac14_Fab1_bd/PF1275